MGMSISLKKDTRKTNIKHNNRKMSDKEKEQNMHIDFSRSSENNYLVSKSLKELYKTEFGQAQKDYNYKQKRADRKITNYYEQVQKGKKTSLQQEMILQVGDKDDFKDNPENQKLANELLEEWFQKFEERNPNLKVYNAVIHNDEASPHMHLNFVPVATGYKRGMEKQVSFDRAILQQDQILDKERPFEDWRNQEVQLLEKMLKERGLERSLVGTNDFKDVNDLKEKKDQLRELEKETLQKKEELRNLENDVNLKKMKSSFLDEKIIQIEQKLKKNHEVLQKDVQVHLKAIESSKAVESIKVESGGVFDRKNVKMPIEDFESIKTLAKASEALKRQNKKLEHDLNNSIHGKQDLQAENSRLKNENEELKRENEQLQETNRIQTRTIRYLNDMVHLFKKNSQKFLEVSRENMVGFIGKVRATALTHEFTKTSFEKLMTVIPEEEQSGAKAVFDLKKEAEKQKQLEKKQQINMERER